MNINDTITVLGMLATYGAILYFLSRNLE